MEREPGPMMGTIRVGRDVYTIRQGTGWPVELWRDGTRIGYVTPYELEMACDGHVPGIRVGIDGTRRLAERHFRLRQAIGELIRMPDPAGVIYLGQVEAIR